MKAIWCTRKGYIVALAVLVMVTVFPPSPAVGAVSKNKAVAGKSLKLLGTAIREFLFVDIYSLSAYSESGECSMRSVIYKSEVKALILSMKRTIPKKRLIDNLKDTFTKNLPQGKDTTELQKKINVFLSYFTKDLNKGSYVEIIYIPGQGTLLKQNGARMGQITKGKGFADLIWRSYFGPNTCCPGLKSDILEQCKDPS
ncbi:MAG: chalcone isomerase family protein [Deltaproteobacteria bacterium]|nr:chalcone isomerase family protein [Deltaproteobacteria bacterium]MBN2670965.1 chalcone isomerase family protein [Deltaproteobacteria bacterium]